MELKDEILISCKEQLNIHIDKLKQLNVRKADIEIDLIWFIKNKLYKEDFND